MTDMNTNPYMTMPTVQGIQMPGVYCRGENIPVDPYNETWKEFQIFVAEGGEPLPFNPALAWDGEAWTLDPARQASLLDAARAHALQAIDQFHADALQRLVGNPTQAEKDTWSLKLEVANAIVGEIPVSAAGQAFLASAGMETITSRLDWTNLVLANAAAYATVVGIAERLRDIARTAVRAASTEADIAAALDAQRSAAEQAIAQLPA